MGTGTWGQERGYGDMGTGTWVRGHGYRDLGTGACVRGHGTGAWVRGHDVALSKEECRKDHLFNLKYNHIKFVHCKYVNYCKIKAHAHVCLVVFGLVRWLPNSQNLQTP